MTTRENMFYNIKEEIKEVTKNNEEVFVITLGARVYCKYHIEICGKAASMKEAEAIVKEFESKYQKELDENKLVLAYLWAPTAYTPSSLVSNMAFQR